MKRAIKALLVMIMALLVSLVFFPKTSSAQLTTKDLEGGGKKQFLLDKVTNEGLLLDNGWVLKIGDVVKVGKPSNDHHEYEYIHSRKTGFLNSPGDAYHLKEGSVRRVVIKRWQVYGTKRAGWTVTAIIGIGEMANFELEPDRALEYGEIEPPAKYTNTQRAEESVVNKGSAADELKKWKDLFDSGAITQEEYDKKREEILK